MADLKLGSQIGGNLIWHQGILELNPVDDAIAYKTFDMITSKGGQTINGSIDITGTINANSQTYGYKSLPTAVTGKNYLRQFKSNASASIWHETVDNNTYVISTGNTDTNPQFTIVNGNYVTFTHKVLTSAAQSSDANAFTRRDYVIAEDAKKLNLTGGNMTGNIDFPNDAQGIRVKFPGGSTANNTGVFGGTGDGAVRTNTNMQIKSWQGLGFAPTSSSGLSNGVTYNENSIWMNLRNGNTYNAGRVYVQSDQEVYSPVNKPTPGDLNAYTKAEIDNKSWMFVADERAAMIPPSALRSKSIAGYFTNQSDVSSSWVSGFTVNGWESTYSAWSLFAGARSDVDDKRLWFKYGRSTWSPSYRIFHENDLPTNNELNLVSRAGDTMTGILNVNVPGSVGYGNYSIKLNNGSIGGINQLVFNNPSDTQSEGIAWPKTGKNDTSTTNADYDILWALDGNLKFNGQNAYGEWNKPTPEDCSSTPRTIIPTGGSAVTFTRIASMPATIGSGGNSCAFILSGGNNFADRTIPVLSISGSTRGYTGSGTIPNNVFRIVSLNESRVQSTFSVILVAGRLELWMSRPNYSSQIAITVMNDWGVQIHGNNASALPVGTSAPAIVEMSYTTAYKPVVGDVSGALDKSGDTMTGNLTMSGSAPIINFVETDSSNKNYLIVADCGGIRLNENTTTGTAIWQYLPANDALRLHKPEATVMGNNLLSLTTKTYVDTKVGTAVQSVTATGPISSTGGINPVISISNATNAAHGAMSSSDKSKLDGIPSAAVNKTGDTMSGALTATQFKATTNNGFVSSNDNNQGMFVGISTDKRTIIGGGSGTGTVTLRPLGIGAATGQFEMWSNLAKLSSDLEVTGTAKVASDLTLAGLLTFTKGNLPLGQFALNMNNGEIGKLNRLIFNDAANSLDEGILFPKTGKAGTSSVVGDYDVVDALDGHLRLNGVNAYGVWNKPTVADIAGAMPVTTLGTEDLNSIIQTGIYEQNANAHASAERNYPENLAGSLTVTGGAGPKQSYHVYNTSRVYTRARYSTGAFTPWVRNIDASMTTIGRTTNDYSEFTNKIPYMESSGVMEVGKYIDMHDAGSNVDYSVRLNAGPSLDVTTQFGTCSVGPQNTTYCHIYTDRPQFYMNKDVLINNAKVMVDKGSYETVYTSSWFRSTGDTGWYNQTHGGGIYMTDGTWIRTYNGKKFHIANADADSLYMLGGMSVVKNGSFNDVQIRSDERLKSNYETIENAVDKVGHLTGITYDKVGKETREAGIIAQRLQEVLPEAIGTVKDSMDENAIEYLTVSSSGVNALLVEAIKELTARIKVLESKQ